MTICNMSIEAGARAGMIAPDETTFEYIATGDRPHAPRGAALEKSIAFWKTLKSDDGATFDREITIDTSTLVAADQLGHEPGHGGGHRRRGAGAATTCRRCSRTTSRRRWPTWT
jgi:3-isopropylmalate/(R)-2-methylmalate dehydratase large subunit